jgi:hypothetical protein
MSFYGEGLLALRPTPNPQPGGPVLCIYNPQRQGGGAQLYLQALVTHFGCLLQPV